MRTRLNNYFTNAVHAVALSYWAFGLCFLVTLFFASCKTKEKVTTHIDTDTQVEVVTDSIHYVITTNLVDTTHIVKIETEKIKTIEEFDPETGILRQRITESERNAQSLLDQITLLQARIDSLQAHSDVEIQQEVQVTHKEKKSSNTQKIITLIFGIALLGVMVYIAIKSGPTKNK